MQTNPDILKLRELIRDIDVAMLTTIDEEQRLISRPMAMQKAEFDGTLWFFTRDDAPKANQLSKHHEVNVAFTNTRRNCYISIAGQAVVYHDREKARELWSPALKIWFKDGLDDPHLALLKVTANYAEIWEGPSNLVTKLIGFAKGLISDDHQLGGEHQKFAVNQ